MIIQFLQKNKFFRKIIYKTGNARAKDMINKIIDIKVFTTGCEYTKTCGVTMASMAHNKTIYEAMDISAPIEDVRATASYQKKMVRNLTYRALNEIWAMIK